ncbi:MAG: iron chelate uptake ABC transporter family permease subunit, partial [Gammaproteobacteria bacterium]
MQAQQPTAQPAQAQRVGRAERGGQQGRRGVGVERVRVGGLLVGTLLTAVATASAGPVAFVALAAPQIGRRLTRATGPGVVIVALTGSALLLASDVLAQRLFPSTPLPVGV